MSIATTLEPRIRAEERYRGYEIDELEEFCCETDKLFKTRIKRERERLDVVLKQKGPITDIDVFVADATVVPVLEGQRTLSHYFGLLMAFSVLEQHLQWLYDTTLALGTTTAMRDVVFEIAGVKKFSFDRAQHMLKALDVPNVKSVTNWNALLKLKRLRDAIVHQGGTVDESNVKSLSPYGYKRLNSKISVSLNDVLAMFELVKNALAQIDSAYGKAIRKLRASSLGLAGPE